MHFQLRSRVMDGTCLKRRSVPRIETTYAAQRGTVGVVRRIDAKRPTLPTMDERMPVEPSLQDANGEQATHDHVHLNPEPDRLDDDNYVGEDNIREGRVGGVMG